MAKAIQIEFVSDVVCPWCVIGLRELERALARLTDVVQPTIEMQPFELNPSMAPEGQDLNEHITEKYGRPTDQMSETRKMLRNRAAELGFTMPMKDGSRVYNTFDAHRLLHWAGLEGRQIELKHALFGAYFSDTQNISDHDVLVAKAESAGLYPVEARKVLTEGLYADEVRQAEQTWMASGIRSVPAVVINRKYLISGGQTAAVFEDSLRKIAAEI